ncbi:EcsC family protein [Rhodalgimonas zhirmunskyi]|uniref:EcsC family protein n=1 Tax=Rhodalgimonas zhirmunskyi TaxID=2964767 RepID=A0AAJ1X487_9RHOB|nr:EcsC family protein [Rhodoalgimonas zhirmunskyi]MDQ2093231.1 EcsC family protein [Rhodoalgimonas zhirmunskyi]
MEIIDNPPANFDAEAQLDALARRYQSAGGAGLQVLNLIGGQAESLLDKLPDGIRTRLGEQTETALNIALRAASTSRRAVPDQPSWINTALTAAMGAAGGMGGLPSALAELPVTTTFLLRAIQGIAAEHGFDPEEEGVKFDCIQVFAAAGPLDTDDGSDLAFISTRLLLRGQTIQTLIARVAPRLSVVLGQKLAAQTLPVLGAVAGAATNYAYTSYYQEMAHVHFGLRRLAITTDRDFADLVEDLRERIAKPVVKRA